MTYVDLAPLEQDDVHTLTSTLLGGEPTSLLLESLARVAGGNPLFIEETLRLWLARGYLRTIGSYRSLAKPFPQEPATGAEDIQLPSARERARKAFTTGNHEEIARWSSALAARLPAGSCEQMRAIEDQARATAAFDPRAAIALWGVVFANSASTEGRARFAAARRRLHEDRGR